MITESSYPRIRLSFLEDVGVEMLDFSLAEVLVRIEYLGGTLPITLSGISEAVGSTLSPRRDFK